MASEDSASYGWLPVIHRLNNRRDLDETVDAEVATLLHELENLDELLKVLALRCPQRMRLEERDDDLIEIDEPPDDVPVQRLAVVVPPWIDVDPPTSEVIAKGLERLNARRALDYHELRLHLPPNR